MISPGHLLISTVPTTADKFIPADGGKRAALSRGFDVAAANVPLRENAPFAYAGERDCRGKQLGKTQWSNTIWVFLYLFRAPASAFAQCYGGTSRWGLIDYFLHRIMRKFRVLQGASEGAYSV